MAQAVRGWLLAKLQAPSARVGEGRGLPVNAALFSAGAGARVRCVVCDLYVYVRPVRVSRIGNVYVSPICKDGIKRM